MSELSIRGGIRVGSSYWLAANWTVPFAELRLSQDTVTLRYPFNNEINIQKNDITRINKKRGIFSAGVQMVHSVETIQPYILFWTFQPDQVSEAFRNMGYPVEG